MSVSVITAPATEPISLETAKQHLRVDTTDEDTLIGKYIVAAREYVETVISAAVPTQTRERRFNAFPKTIEIEPFVSIESIKYIDCDRVEQTLADTEYYVDGPSGSIISLDGWPLTATVPGAVKVQYIAGSDTPPNDLLQAMLLLIGFWYEHRAEMMLPSAEANAVNALCRKHRNYRGA